MEKEGFCRLLIWFAKLGLPVRSVATDRHAHFRRVIEELNDTLGWNMKWYFDRWHLGRYMVNALREVSSAQQNVFRQVECINNCRLYHPFHDLRLPRKSIPCLETLDWKPEGTPEKRCREGKRDRG